MPPKISSAPIVELRSARWRQALEVALKAVGEVLTEAASASKGFEWKEEIARKVRTTVAAPNRWFATAILTGHPAVVRGYPLRRTLQSAD